MLTLGNFFILCAVVGGTIMVCQFLLTMIGLGGDADFADDVPDDLSSDSDGGHGSWLFGVISFRTLSAALGFFGLGGWAVRASGLDVPLQLLAAVGSGAAAMYGVHYIMLLFARLSHDGTVRIDGAIGKTGTVYIPIPAKRTGVGKIQLKLQNRIVEYSAMTSGDEKLPTGAKVVVVKLLESSTLEVEPIGEPARPTLV